MLDLLRIVDDGAAGRRGGHLRIEKGFIGAKRGEYATEADSLKHSVWAMCIVK